MCPLPSHCLKLRDKSNPRLAATLETRLNRVWVSRRLVVLLLLCVFLLQVHTVSITTQHAAVIQS